MNVLLGASGRLGSALRRTLPAERTVCIDRDTCEHWSGPDGADAVRRHFECDGLDGATVYVAAGLIDPRLPAMAHARANVGLPVNLMAGLAGSRAHVVTFGTVMERLLAAAPAGNPYLASKIMWARHAGELIAAGRRLSHIRVHTLYGGGLPAPAMFLGQIVHALRSGEDFRMSPGRQLREYHHVDDDARAIVTLVSLAAAPASVDLNHGRPVRLAELASHLFSTLGDAGRLKVGALPAPDDDNYGEVLPVPEPLAASDFRDTLAGVTAYLADCLAREEILS